MPTFKLRDKFVIIWHVIHYYMHCDLHGGWVARNSYYGSLVLHETRLFVCYIYSSCDLIMQGYGLKFVKRHCFIEAQCHS